MKITRHIINDVGGKSLASEDDKENFAKKYLEVFSHKTWNDWIYDKKAGLSRNAKGEVARTFQQQMQKIDKEYLDYDSGKLGSVITIMKNDLSDVIGFSTGWYGSLEKVVEKLDLDEETYSGFVKKISELGLGGKNFFYISKMGIDKENRGRGLSKYLQHSRMEQAIEDGYTHALLRTSLDEVQPLGMYTDGGGVDLGRQVQGDYRSMLMYLDLEKYLSYSKNKYNME